MTVETDPRAAPGAIAVEQEEEAARAASKPEVEQPGELETRLGALQSFVEHSSRTLQDSIDLAGATFREELDGFASAVTWRAAAAFCGGTALVLLTAAAVLLVRELSGSWSLAFLLPGLVYGTAAAVIAITTRA